jgi:hypothetical protein
MVNATGDAVYVKFHSLVTSTLSLFPRFFFNKMLYIFLKWLFSYILSLNFKPLSFNPGIVDISSFTVYCYWVHVR